MITWVHINHTVTKHRKFEHKTRKQRSRQWWLHMMNPTKIMARLFKMFSKLKKNLTLLSHNVFFSQSVVKDRGFILFPLLNLIKAHIHISQLRGSRQTEWEYNSSIIVLFPRLSKLPASWNRLLSGEIHVFMFTAGQREEIQKGYKHKTQLLKLLVETKIHPHLT